MKNFISWLITSSSDPEKISLAVKGLVGMAIFFGIDSSVANEGAGHIITLIGDFGMLGAACVSAWGFIRKVINGKWAAVPPSLD